MCHCREALEQFSMAKGSDGTPQLDGANLMQPMPKAPQANLLEQKAWWCVNWGREQRPCAKATTYFPT